MTATLIQRVRLVDALAATDRVADVRIEDGEIAAIGEGLSAENAEVIDGSDQVLLPGLAELHSYPNEPGHEDRETLEQLLRSAMGGGFTRLGLLPTTVPALDTPAAVADLLERRRRIAEPMPQLCPWAAITRGAAGQQLAELGELADTAAVGFADGEPLADSQLSWRLLQYLRSLELPVMLWSCDRTLTSGPARDSLAAQRLGLAGDPDVSETAALAALLEQVRSSGTPVHLMRISTARGVALVAAAKADGLPVTASTPWMHLVLDSEGLTSYDPALRLAPPLGRPEDRAALVAAVADGTLDAVAIDHRAYSYEEKTVGFASAPAGAIGLELALPLLWQTLVAPGTWSPQVLVRALSLAPAQIWRQPPPTLQPQHPAEMVLFDPAIPWTVSSQTLATPAANTPWWHQPLQGRVQRVWLP